MDHVNRLELADALVRLVALHDNETADHLRATAVLARIIAAVMDVPAATADTIELGALVHDIGKVHVPVALLRKPGGLTLDEWVEMRCHAEAGAGVVADLPPLAHLAPMVRAHHERVDGEGYPDRLRGDEIPLGARVIAVADALHALTADRPYRAAIPLPAALDVLAAAAGSQFDRHIVTAAVDAFGGHRTSRRLSA